MKQRFINEAAAEEAKVNRENFSGFFAYLHLRRRRRSSHRCYYFARL